MLTTVVVRRGSMIGGSRATGSGGRATTGAATTGGASTVATVGAAHAPSHTQRMQAIALVMGSRPTRFGLLRPMAPAHADCGVRVNGVRRACFIDLLADPAAPYPGTRVTGLFWNPSVQS